MSDARHLHFILYLTPSEKKLIQDAAKKRFLKPSIFARAELLRLSSQILSENNERIDK